MYYHSAASKIYSPVGLEVDECLENAKTPDLADKVQLKNKNL
jgi:hypothetical protein